MGVPDGHPFFGNQYTDGGYIPGSYSYANEIVGKVINAVSHHMSENTGTGAGNNITLQKSEGFIQTVIDSVTSNKNVAIGLGIGLAAVVGGYFTYRHIKKKAKSKHEAQLSITLEHVGVCIHCSEPLVGSSVNDGDAKNALVLFGRYPANNSPIDLGQRGSLTEDDESDFFSSSVDHLCRAITSRVFDIVADGESIALFPLAPQPLLMYLGHLLNDKYNVAVFQCHRRERDKWRWEDTDERITFQSILPEAESTSKNIALVFSLSSTISLGSGYSVMWQVVNTGDEASCANCIISKDTSRLNTRDALCAGFLIEAREMHGHVS